MKKWNEKTYILTIIGTILGLVSMMLFNHFTFYYNINAKMKNMGIGYLNEMNKALEYYLSKNMNALQTTSITLEYMMEENASKEELKDFLVYASEKYTREIDGSFSGIYGLFNDEYIHGNGWTPDDDYVTQEREWYITAKEANGETVLVSPYCDAITNTIMLSISKMLSDNKSVVSIDFSPDQIQSIIEETDLNNFGYSFVVDDDGMIICHTDVNERGNNYLTDEKMKNFLEDVMFHQKTYFTTKLNGTECQIFADKILADWHIIMVADRESLFKDVHNTFLRNILLCGIISALIVFFYIYTFKRLKESMELERTSNQKIELTNMNMIRALVRTIDAKDRYTNGHSIRVAEYALKIAKRLGKSSDEQRTIYYAGLLHDVGKIRVPEDIINKPGKLTDEEFEQIKIHSVTGYHILKDIYEDKTIALGVKFHHERYDGKGYPSGLTGENIPEIARIIGVADTYDAMTSNRSYRSALSQEKVRQEIEKGKGTQFDPQIADIMLQMIDMDKEYTLKENDTLQKTILVVDDDYMNIRMTELIMADEPMYNILSASSGKEALQLLEKNTVDLIILDVNMPDMDGFETFSNIREKYNMPVAFITGNRDIKTIQRATKLGVNDYISKPFVPLAFKEIVHSILHE